MILLYAVRRPGFVRRRKTRRAPRRARARSTTDYTAVVNRSALGGTATGSHPHTHTPTRTHIYPHTSTIKRIIYTLYTPCRVRAVYNMYNNNIYFVVQCSRRQNIIIISNIILWRDVFYYTLRPRSLSPTWRQKNQFMTWRDFKTRTEYTTCV